MAKFKDFYHFLDYFKKHYPVTSKYTDWYFYEDGKLILAIDVENNEVLAESIETFNKWSQAYLKTKVPKNTKELKMLLKDLKEIIKPEHVERSNNFERYYD